MFPLILTNFLFNIIVIWVLRKIIIKFKPKGLYLEKNNQKIAKIGGIVLLLSFLIFYRKIIPVNSLTMQILLTAFLIFILGFIDDLKELKVWQKFLGEIVIILIFIILSKLTTEIIFFPKYINFIITFIWILGITNSFNLLDIQDGLATGIGFLITLSFLYLAYLTGNKIVGDFSLLLLSSLLAIFIFNFPPAKIYLGDSGSLSLGYIFSILAILISYAKASHEMALLSPLFILGFPIFDTAFVSLRRLFKGRSVFKKSDDHFILCLIAKGKKKIEALFICYLLNLIFIVLGISFTKLSNLFSFFLILLFFIFLSYFSLRINKE